MLNSEIQTLYADLKSNLTSIANAIRKYETGSTSGTAINPQNFSSRIRALGTGNQPTLNVVSIAWSSSSSTTIVITNPSTNGNFVTGYKIYIKKGSTTKRTISTTSTSYNLANDFARLTGGSYDIYAVATGKYWNESPLQTTPLTYSIATGFQSMAVAQYNNKTGTVTGQFTISMKYSSTEQTDYTYQISATKNSSSVVLLAMSRSGMTDKTANSYGTSVHDTITTSNVEDIGVSWSGQFLKVEFCGKTLQTGTGSIVSGSSLLSKISNPTSIFFKVTI